MRTAKLLLGFTLLFVLAFTATASFKCSSPSSTCQSLIDYVSPNATTLSNISTLFGIKNFLSLLGANSLPVNTPSNQPVAAKQAIKIPFPCICNNGTGTSNRTPIYKVEKGDGLDHIARDIFSGLMTFTEIATVNNIPDPDKIKIGQELWIPLPCSCDTVDGAQVVHYGHVVTNGSSVKQIAADYGTTEATLLSLNDLANAKDLMAGAVLEVPLKVCTSMISKTSLDYPLLVPNGTYTITANGCVQCDCHTSNNWTLQCKSSPASVKVQNWPQCPSRQCSGTQNLALGNTSKSSNPCNVTFCAYTGYTSQNIFTTLANESTCPGNGAPQAPPSPSGAAKINLQQSKMSSLLNLGLLLFVLW